MRSRVGFTLIEIMIVVAIIATLAAVSIPSMLAATRAANERSASVALKALASAEEQFKASDADHNGQKDYWVGDISGLYRIALGSATSEPIKLIELPIAEADGNRLADVPAGNSFAFNTAVLSNSASAAKAGFFFQVLKSFEVAGNSNQAYPDATGHQAEHFGFIAYPQTYGSSGRLAFILNEAGTIYRKALDGGGCIVGTPPSASLVTIGALDYTKFPLDPTVTGWSKMD